MEQRRARWTSFLVASVAALVVVPMAVGGPAFAGDRDVAPVTDAAASEAGRIRAAPGGAAATGTAPRVPAGSLDRKVFTVDGRGYGHGRGMSQHGAQGAALAGLDHRQIVAYYYPTTSISQAKRKIRVLITADTDDDLTVQAQDGLILRDRVAKKRYRLPTRFGATQWRLSGAAGGGTRVSYRTDDSWVDWKRVSPMAGEGQFRRGLGATVVLPHGSAAYRGWLRASVPTGSPAESSRRHTVNVLGLDGYLRGVVPAEMPATWQPEAVQAQAVAARTYAVFNRDLNATRDYQICDTTSCQVYRGIAGEHPAADAAIAATAGEILVTGDAGGAAFTQFSASSGGWTVDGGRPYLTAHRDAYDNWPGNSSHRWTTTISARRVLQTYPGLGRLRGIAVTKRDGNGQWNGRALAVVLKGSTRNVTISGEAFRFAFGLRSSWFKLS